MDRDQLSTEDREYQIRCVCGQSRTPGDGLAVAVSVETIVAGLGAAAKVATYLNARYGDADPCHRPFFYVAPLRPVDVAGEQLPARAPVDSAEARDDVAPF